jgi:hypothetical protein
MSSVAFRADLPAATGWLKQLALFFDHVEFPAPEAPFRLALLARQHSVAEEAVRHSLAEYEWLRCAGVATFPYAGEDLPLQEYVELAREWPDRDPASFDDAGERAAMRAIRIHAAEARAMGRLAFVVTGGVRCFERALADGRIGTVIRVAVQEFPRIPAETPWEDILEFRTDPDSNRKTAMLRRWITNIASAERSPVEIAQEIEFLVAEYEHHMALHRLKTKRGVLEAVVTASAEVAESVAKLKWGQLAKLPFAVKQRRIALLEAEATAPGRELAIIAKARQRFARAD